MFLYHIPFLAKPWQTNFSVAGFWGCACNLGFSFTGPGRTDILRWNQYEAPPPRQAWAHSHLPEGSGGRGLKQQDWIGEELCQMDVEELCDIDKYR